MRLALPLEKPAAAETKGRTMNLDFVQASPA
jgi:hypothetical protein